MTFDRRHLGIAALLAAATVLAGAQTTAPGTGASGAKTPADMPPGAKSTRGDKGATPASGSMAATGATPTNPETGSTPGLPPGAKSARGDKATTPKGTGKPASSAM